MKIIDIVIPVKIIGRVQALVDNDVVFETSNHMSIGMGFVFAAALRTGTCKQISYMHAIKQGETARTVLSTPTRTAGGQGGTDSVTVQSTYTNNSGGAETYERFYLGVPPFDIDQTRLDIAYQTSDSVTVPNLAVMTINWEIEIPSTTCQFSANMRNDMAQGISPEAGHGGVLENLSDGQWVFTVGNSGLQNTTTFIGGTGFTQDLTVQTDWAATANKTLSEVEQYNSNGDLVQETTGLTDAITLGDNLRINTVINFQGV